jgi:cob(I)alamin adenosyltransferase
MLMSVTTKTGDDGKSRFLGKVVDKDSDLLEAVGTLDELQALIEDGEIQKDLYGIMGELGYDKKVDSLELRVTSLEKEIERIEKDLKPITGFLIFKNQKAREINFARTVCRRAERRLVTLSRSQQIDPNILIYINRLSDYLFMLSRREEK